jgi:hypothetical protein
MSFREILSSLNLFIEITGIWCVSFEAQLTAAISNASVSKSVILGLDPNLSLAKESSFSACSLFCLISCGWKMSTELLMYLRD